jgi:hypothetical protein
MESKHLPIIVCPQENHPLGQLQVTLGTTCPAPCWMGCPSTAALQWWCLIKASIVTSSYSLFLGSYSRQMKI